MKKINLKMAQSIIEYICVTAVFAGVSMAGFVLLTQTALSNYRGQATNYETTATLDGQTLNDGVSDSDYAWSPDWNEPQADFYGQTPNTFVNNPDANTLPVPEAEPIVDEFFNQYPVVEE